MERNQFRILAPDHGRRIHAPSADIAVWSLGIVNVAQKTAGRTGKPEESGERRGGVSERRCREWNREATEYSQRGIVSKGIIAR